MTSGAAGTCFAKSPHFASSALRASSRRTMKCHGCVFFELPAIRPACRMRCNVSSEIGSSLYSRLSRFVRMQVLASISMRSLLFLVLNGPLARGPGYRLTAFLFTNAERAVGPWDRLSPDSIYC